MGTVGGVLGDIRESGTGSGIVGHGGLLPGMSDTRATGGKWLGDSRERWRMRLWCRVWKVAGIVSRLCRVIAGMCGAGEGGDGDGGG